MCIDTSSKGNINLKGLKVYGDEIMQFTMNIERMNNKRLILRPICPCYK
jgi:hypothetical protein